MTARSSLGVLLALALAIVLPTSAAAASPSPVASPSPGGSITWDSGIVRLTADSLSLVSGGTTYTGAGPADIHSDPGDATYRTLEVEWQEGGARPGVTVYLTADRDSWWVTELRAGERSSRQGQVTLPIPAIRAPIGGTWTGDLHLADGTTTLDLTGVTLRAFAPGTIPAQLRFCRPGLPAGGDPDTTDPLAPGQPLAGTGIATLTPAGAKALLQSMGLCHVFHYDVSFGDGTGFGELWCDPPPGRITGVRYGMDGEVLVFVEDATPQLHTPRPQPPVGWGC
ncbi:MAG: hypothetical protein U0869_08330 [Chloroflexota bacterium]